MINLIGGQNWKPGAHAKDIKNRILAGFDGDINLVDKDLFDSGNFNSDETSIIATPISIVEHVTRKMAQTMRENWNIGHIIVAGIMGKAIAGPNDVLWHFLFGPKAPLDPEKWKQHMMVFWRINGEIDNILRLVEAKGIQVHETYPKEHNALMARVQVIPTLLQVGLSLWDKKANFIKDPAYTEWVTPTNTLREMIELNDFSPSAVALFNDLIAKTEGDLHDAFEELLKSVPQFAITPNCARVRDFLRRERPKNKTPIQKPYPGYWINSIIDMARKKKGE